jgi:hypothetical protein
MFVSRNNERKEAVSVDIFFGRNTSSVENI